MNQKMVMLLLEMHKKSQSKAKVNYMSNMKNNILSLGQLLERFMIFI